MAASPPTPFTPEKIDFRLCVARTWNKGLGGQCIRHPTARNGFCLQHAKNERWRAHGRVDGPVPPAKLKEFKKVEAPRKTKATKGVAGEDVPAEMDSDDEHSIADRESDSDAELEEDQSCRLHFGSGAIMGAEAVGAHIKLTDAATMPDVASSSGGGLPSTPPRKRALQRGESDPNKRSRRTGKQEQMQKAVCDAPGSQTGQQVPLPQEFVASCEEYGVPAESCMRLAPLFQRWGQERAAQILGLWTFLGDGAIKPVSVPNLHVWGPSGTGKTAVLVDFLDSLKIRSVWLNCACFTALGELQARLVELLRRSAIELASTSENAPSVPRDLLHRLPAGKQLRALDRLELAHRAPLEYIVKAEKGSPGVKVVVVLDEAQELARLGGNAADIFSSLPEVLHMGNRIACLTVAGLPLSKLGLVGSRNQDPGREPQAVVFLPYTDLEAEAVLFKVLSKVDAHPIVKPNLKIIVGSGIMKFAAPHLGRNIRDLLSLGQELVSDRDFWERVAASEHIKHFTGLLQRRVQQAVESRLGLFGLSGLQDEAASAGAGRFDDAEPNEVAAATASAMRLMTKAERRLVLAAYLASRISKDDDIQLFAPRHKQHRRRGGAHMKRRQRKDDGQPSFTRPPRPAPLARVFAIYHHLARQPQLLGGPLFEHLARLREVGLLRLERQSQEHDARLLCCAELPLARACAGDLDIDLAEYLCEH